MNFNQIILVISFLVKLSASFDIGSLNSIEEIIDFVAGVADFVNEDKIRAAEKLVDDFEIDGLRNYRDIVRKYFFYYPHMNVTDQDIEELESLIGKIDDAWTKFRYNDTAAELREFVKVLPKILSQLYNFYVGNAEDVKGFPTRVVIDWRPWAYEITINDQLRLRKLHQIAILSELRGFILSLKASENPQKAAARAIFHSQQFLIASHQGFLFKWNQQRSCDPVKHIRGETFSEFLGLMQALVVNELQTDITDDSNCVNDCRALDSSRLVRCYEFDSPDGKMTHCHTKPCNGLLFDCFKVSNTKGCELDKSSDRRFQWTRGLDTDTSQFSCPGKVVKFYEVPKNPTPCSNCVCVCIEQEGNSTAMRTISFIPQLADIHRNMVMTGVRFAEKDRMFHLQIEQAQLGPFGEIVPGTEEWKELGEFQYDSADEGGFRMKKGKEFVKLIEFEDFSFVTLDPRMINLDQIFAKDGEVLIGARFAFNMMQDAFEIQIKSWPADLRTGKLADGNPSDVEWIGWKNAQPRSKNYDGMRSYLDIGGSMEPLEATNWNVPVSFPNQVLMIQTTDYSSDLRQHTIPYIDLQPVTYSMAKIPLSGLEIIYKRARGYGGFLGFKIFGFDFSKDFKWKMSASDFNKYRTNFHERLVLKNSIE